MLEIVDDPSEKITDTVVESYGEYVPKSDPSTYGAYILIFSASAVLIIALLLILSGKSKKKQ